MKIGDSETESDTYYSNYNEKDGIIMPYSIESRMNGQTVSQVNIVELFFDEEIDDSIFAMPEKQVTEEVGEGEGEDEKDKEKDENEQ